MNKLLDSCSGCPRCIPAELLVSPQLLQYWEEKVRACCDRCSMWLAWWPRRTGLKGRPALSCGPVADGELLCAGQGVWTRRCRSPLWW